MPAIFVRTPYNFNTYRDGVLQTRQIDAALDAVKRGYAYIVQNERGRYFSEGEWDILGPPKTDGYDALTWIADQSWSNGKVGTLGCSSTAEWQMGLAALDHPAHAAMIPQGFGAGVGRVAPFYEQGNWYRGGAEQMLFFAWLYGVQNTQRPTFPVDMPHEDMVRLSRYFDLAPEMPSVDWSRALWHLPVEDILRNFDGPKGIFADPAPVATGGRMIQRAPDDPAWYRGGLYHDDEPFGVPSFWWMSWYDVSVGPNLALFNHVTRHATDPEVAGDQFALIAPVGHCAFRRATEETIVGERSMGDPRLDWDALTYGWFDYWLKGEDNGFVETTPKVQYYTMGLNEWQASDTWPPADAEMVTYYLSSDGEANSLFGDGRLVTDAPGSDDAADVFAYDPFNPVRSYGGNVCCTGNAIETGSFDQRRMEARHDILIYTSDPLTEGIEVSGTIEVTLYVSVGCARHRFHREADRRLSRWKGLQPGRDDPACALSRGLRPAGVHGGQRGLRADGEPDVDEQLFRRGAPHPDRGVEQQFPEVHSQPQYGRQQLRRDGRRGGAQHGAPLATVPVTDRRASRELDSAASTITKLWPSSETS